MTFYHFANCMALACVPYHLLYKYSGLAEYGAFWKCVTAGFVYIITQLVKMVFLATFFPTSEDDDDFLLDKEIPFDALTEFLKLTVDLADLIGLYFVMQRVAGKGQVKILVAGVGWAFADFLLTRVIFLWVGARGIEFDWKYMQKSFDANIDLVHYLTLACLVWLWMRREVSGFGNAIRTTGVSSASGMFQHLFPLVVLLTVLCSYKTLLLDLTTNAFDLGSWTSLAFKAFLTATLGLITMQIYVGITTVLEKR